MNSLGMDKQSGLRDLDNEDPLRIVLLAHSCNPEWVSESYVGYQWFAHLRRRHNVLLVTRMVNKRALTETGAKNVLYLDAPKFLGSKKLHEYGCADYFLFNLKIWFKLRKHIAIFQPHLIHLVTPIGPRYSTYLSYLPVPLIIGPLAGGLLLPKGFRSLERTALLHNLYHRFGRLRFLVDPCLARTYSKASRILVACNYVRDYLRPAWQHKTVQILETAVNPIYFTQPLPLNSSPVRVLFVGRLVPTKGVEMLLRAFGKIHRSSGVLLDIVGAGPQENALKTLAHQFGIERVTRFHGWMEQSKVREMYSVSNIFCLPSLNDSTGNVLLEAMASGLPVVTTNYGGPAEIVNEECGILVDPTDEVEYVNNLAEALLRLAKNSELRVRMGLAGRERCRNIFTWEAKMQRMSQVYREVVDEAGDQRMRR